MVDVNPACRYSYSGHGARAIQRVISKLTRMTILETDRLRLRMFRQDDFDDYARMCADPEVRRYIGAGQTLARGRGVTRRQT